MRVTNVGCMSVFSIILSYTSCVSMSSVVTPSSSRLTSFSLPMRFACASCSSNGFSNQSAPMRSFTRSLYATRRYGGVKSITVFDSPYSI